MQKENEPFTEKYLVANKDIFLKFISHMTVVLFSLVIAMGGIIWAKE